MTAHRASKLQPGEAGTPKGAIPLTRQRAPTGVDAVLEGERHTASPDAGRGCCGGHLSSPEGDRLAERENAGSRTGAGDDEVESSDYSSATAPEECEEMLRKANRPTASDPHHYVKLLSAR